MEHFSFDKIQSLSGSKIKEPHTVVEKWPMKLKLRHGEKGAKEEFDALFTSSHVGTER